MPVLIVPIVIAASIYDVTGIVVAVAAVITVALAFATVRVARETVKESRTAREESRRAHEEEVRQETALLAEMKGVRRVTIDEATDVFRRDLVLQRLVALERVGHLLREVTRIARSEQDTQEPWLNAWSPMPAALAHLEVAVSIYRALGGEETTQKPHPERRIRQPERWEFLTVTRAILEFAAGLGLEADRQRMIHDSVVLLGRITDLVSAEELKLRNLRASRLERSERGDRTHSSAARPQH